nr:helix-turn-helix domain-containing protein [Marinitoga litoralis]
MLQTYKFRIYPTNEQKEKLNKHFGSTRFIYNFFCKSQHNNVKKRENKNVQKNN